MKLRRLVRYPGKEPRYRGFASQSAKLIADGRELCIRERAVERAVADRMKPDSGAAAAALGDRVMLLNPRAKPSSAEPAIFLVFLDHP